MSDIKKIKAIEKYLKTTRKKLDRCQKDDSEYTTSLGNGVNCFEAGSMFDEVESKIGKILNAPTEKV